jgi:hypothetical protein
MDRIEKHTQAFIKVKNRLHKPETIFAYNLSWKKPLKFYGEHTEDEAVKILIREAKRKSNVKQKKVKKDIGKKK